MFNGLRDFQSSAKLPERTFDAGIKFGVFQVFFLTFGANPCFWVKNGCWYVNMRDLGDMGKKNASKNVEKIAKIGINFNKFGKIQLFWRK